jgi:hypothetical protein
MLAGDILRLVMSGSKVRYDLCVIISILKSSTC